MERNYTVYKCQQCGTVFIIPNECVDYSNNYISCPLHGRHHKINVIGAYGNLKECMENRTAIDVGRIEK